MPRLVAAEWLKLRTTRILWVSVPAVVLLSAAAVGGAVLSADGAGVALESTEGVRRALHVTGTGCALVLVLGIIISAAEYRTQTATDTFLTTPKRSRVLTAKLVIGALIGLALGLLTAAVCLVVAYLLFDAEGASFPTGNEEVWLTLGGAVLYAVLFGILGVAFGSLVRNQVAAIVAALAWLLLIEQLLAEYAESVVKWFPAAAGQAVVRTPGREFLEPGLGAVLLLAYGLAIAAAGIAVAARRDA